LSARARLDYGGRVNLHTYPGRWVCVVAVALPSCAIPPRSSASAPPPEAPPSVEPSCEHLTHYAAPDGVPTVPLAVSAQLDLSGWYIFDRVCVDLDGARLFVMVPSVDNREPRGQGDLPTRVTRGQHTLTVTVILKGATEFNGSRVAAGFHFLVESSHQFAAENENGMSVAARIYERKGRPLQQRPAVSWIETPIP
jgi:hypothetical protein